MQVLELTLPHETETREGSAQETAPSKPAAAETKGGAKILRFYKSERLLHWAIAIPFLVCFASALVMVVHYNPDPHRPYRALFSWAHRISGVCLIDPLYPLFFQS